MSGGRLGTNQAGSAGIGGVPRGGGSSSSGASGKASAGSPGIGGELGAPEGGAGGAASVSSGGTKAPGAGSGGAVTSNAGNGSSGRGGSSGGSAPHGGSGVGGSGEEGGSENSGGGGAIDDASSFPEVPLGGLTRAVTGTVIDTLEVEQSHFFIDAKAQPAGTWTWLAVVKNTGSAPACNLSIDADFVLHDNQVVRLLGTVATHIYRTPSSNAAIRCLAPGEIGIGASAPSAGKPAAGPSDVASIRYAVIGNVIPTAERANWVTVSNVSVQAARVRGRLTNGSSIIPSWGVDVYPKNGAGMPLAALWVADSRSQLMPSTTWDFETPAHDGNYDDAYVFEKHGNPTAP